MIFRQGRHDRLRQRLPLAPTEAEGSTIGGDTPKVQWTPKRRCGLRGQAARKGKAIQIDPTRISREETEKGLPRICRGQCSNRDKSVRPPSAALERPGVDDDAAAHRALRR